MVGAFTVEHHDQWERVARPSTRRPGNRVAHSAPSVPRVKPLGDRRAGRREPQWRARHSTSAIELVQLLLPREDTVGDQLSANNPRRDDRDKTTRSKGQDLPPTPSSTTGYRKRRRIIP